MSFLIDPAWLYANGRAYAALAPERAQGRTAAALGAATMGTFWAVSVSLYLNKRWTRPCGGCRAEDGRDWMLNSGVFRFDHRDAGPGTHAVSAALFATYPVLALARPGAGRHGDERALRVLVPARRRPAGAARRLDPPHGAPAPGRPVRGLAVVHRVGRRRRAAARGQGDPGAGGRSAAHRRRGVRPGAVRGTAPPARTAPPGIWSRDTAPPLRHLPHPRLYGAPLPRTKLESPAPAARFSGTVEADGRRLELDGWPGMVGHNWGAQHAERWIWLHGIGFDGAPDAWLDLAAGRVRIGPATTPWVANGALHVDGRRHVLGGLRERPEVDARPARRRPRRRRAHPRHRAARADRRLGLRGPARRRAPLAELLDRRAGGHGRRAARSRPPTAASTSWACGSATTAIPVAPFPDP